MAGHDLGTIQGRYAALEEADARVQVKIGELEQTALDKGAIVSLREAYAGYHDACRTLAERNIAVAGKSNGDPAVKARNEARFKVTGGRDKIVTWSNANIAAIEAVDGSLRAGASLAEENKGVVRGPLREIADIMGDMFQLARGETPVRSANPLPPSR